MTASMMRKWLAIFFACICIASTESKAEEISISVLDFCPLHCIGGDGNINPDQPGAVVEIYQKIFGDAGYKAIFRVLPFNRGMMEVSGGRIDAISGPLKFSPEALEDKIRQWPVIGPLYGRLIYPEKTIGTHQSSCFFVRADSDWVFKSERSLDSQRLGTANAHDYGPLINAYIEEALKRGDRAHVQELSGDNMFLRNLKMLVSNRVDVVLIDRTSGSNTIKRAVDNGDLPVGSVKLSQCIGETQNLFLAFSGQYPERSKKLSRVFDKGIEQIRKSGELKTLLGKYGLDDWLDN